jgi:hypothetical protein
MPWIDSLDWTTLNSLRRYPIREGSSATSSDEEFTIPDTLIVDFTLCADSSVSSRFYISKIVNKLSSVLIQVSDFLGVVVGTVEVVKSTHQQDDDYYLTATTDYIGANGKISIGKMDELAFQPAGTFTFENTATEFEPRTIVPGLKRLARMTFSDATNGTYSMTNNVTLAARNNLKFTYLPGSDKVVLDAGDNLGLSKICTTSTCIQSINGVIPDADGNISLLGLECLKISNTSQYTLDISDTCCTPCSGCDDLETLTTRLTSLENKFLDLKGNYNNVNAQLSTYLATINSNCAC